jgi:pimeloyl-ACP methyl ester carboxylesterase
MGSPVQRNQIPNTTILDQHKVRLIIIDRPGFGMSTPDPTCSVLTWHHDALAILDTLGVSQCVLLPYSAGTPYALALASLAPERVLRIHIMSGVIPAAARDLQQMSAFNRWLHSFGNNVPKFWLQPLVALLNLVIGVGAKAGKFGIWLMRGTFTPAENQYAAAPAGQVFRDMLSESFRQGFLHYFTEFAIVGAPWG